MVTIGLSAVPNQGFNVKTPDDTRWSLDIFEINGCMAANVSRDGERILSAARLVAGSPVIPYRYIETGNFFITTMDGEMPWWEYFGSTQQLTYLTADELTELRNG